MNLRLNPFHLLFKFPFININPVQSETRRPTERGIVLDVSPRRHDRRLPHLFSTAKKERRERSPTILRVPATLRDKGRLSETLSDQVVFSLYGLEKVGDQGDPRFQGERRSEAQRNRRGRKGTLERKDTLLRTRRGDMGLQRATMHMYIYVHVCVHVCVRAYASVPRKIRACQS